MFKKLLVSLLIGFTLLISSASLFQAKAQTSWYNQTFPEWYLKVYDSQNPNEIFGERYTAAQVQWIVYSIPSLIINLVTGGNNDIGSCLVGVASFNYDRTKCNISLSEWVQSFTDAILLGYGVRNPPSMADQIFGREELSGIGYIRGTISKLNPVTTVSAQSTPQGFGINAIASIAFIWKITRNISYFFFVLVAVIFSFMIMFRVKLSPQTVVTVQSSLPKLVIALILVTFSFAIAGLLIDLMYVIMALLATFMTPLIGDQVSTIFSFMNASNFGGGLALLLYFVIYLVMYLVALIAIAVAAVAGLNISSIIFAVLLLVFWVILILILIWNIFKVTYILFKNLAEIYGLIIIAPLQISLGALYPQAGFGSWMKKFISKLVIFPLTGAFIYIAIVLLMYSIRISGVGIIDNNVTAELMRAIGIGMGDFSIPVGSWGPPLLGNAASAGGIAFLLMSVGLIMMIPKIGESIESFLAGKGIAGTAIGEAMGPFGGALKGAGGMASGAALGGGSSWLGDRMENYKGAGKFAGFVRSAGTYVKDYGNKSLGRMKGEKQSSSTEVNDPNDTFR